MTATTSEWKFGWTLVMASFVGFMLHSTTASALPAFIAPLEAEFGWSRTVISAGLSVGALTAGLLMPVAGTIVDRFGARRIALPGIVGTTVLLTLFSANSGPEWLWLGLWLVQAFFTVMIGAVIWTTAVAGTFRLTQGLAIGVALAGATAAQTVIPPLSVFLISQFGWRTAFVSLALGLGPVTFLLCYAFFFDRRDRMRLAEVQGAETDPESARELPGLTLFQAAHDRALWLIGLSIVMTIALTIGFTVHLIEILRSVGVSRSNAAWLAGLSGVMGIVGKLATGVLLDRFRGNWVGGTTLGFSALTFLLLLGSEPGMPILIFAMLVNGYTGGAKLQTASYLTVRYAGMRNFGKIYGVISSLVALGTALGPLIAGAAYDLTGGYEVFLAAGTVGLLLAAVFLLVLPRYPDRGQRVSTA